MAPKLTPRHGGWRKRLAMPALPGIRPPAAPPAFPVPLKAQQLEAVLAGARLSPRIRDALRQLVADIIAIETAPRPPLDDAVLQRKRLDALAHHDPAAASAAFLTALTAVIKRIIAAVPTPPPTASALSAPLIDTVAAPPALVEAIVTTLLPFADHGGLPGSAAAAVLKNNLLDVVGLQAEAIDKNPRRLIWPTASPLAGGSAIAHAYLSETPFAKFFATPVPVALTNRFSHHHLVATPGAGKTNLLGTLIAADLDEVAAGRATVIVLDSQVDLIHSIIRRVDFAPGGRLHGRVVYIDPTDVEYPLALNLFARAASAPLLEKRTQLAALFDLLNFLFGAMRQETTGRQETLLRAVAALIQEIPNATIVDLNDIFEPTDRKTPPLEKFRPYIEKLNPSMQQFFNVDFANAATFGQSREQIRARLQSLITDDIFLNLFSSPTQKLDLAAEMNAGKLILINASKDLLGTGTEIFGRFFIALIAQAAQARSNIPASRRLPTYCYIDECHDYIKADTNVEKILDSARKYNVGTILSHQRLSQLTGALQSAASMAAIKMVRAPVLDDKRTLAAQLHSTPEFIDALPRHTFATFQPGLTNAIPVTVPLSPFANAPHMTDAQFAELRRVMRAKYARPRDAPPRRDPEPLPPTPPRIQPPALPPIMPPPSRTPQPPPSTMRAGGIERVFLVDYHADIDAELDPRAPASVLRVNRLTLITKANRRFASLEIETANAATIILDVPLDPGEPATARIAVRLGPHVAVERCRLVTSPKRPALLLGASFLRDQFSIDRTARHLITRHPQIRGDDPQ